MEMDKASHKTSVVGDNILHPRKESGLVPKGQSKSIDQNSHLCTLRNSPGISKSFKTSHTTYLEKIKSPREIPLNYGNSSKSCLSINSAKNSPPLTFNNGLSTNSLAKKQEIGTRFRVEHAESNDHRQTVRNSRQKSRFCVSQEPSRTYPPPATYKSEGPCIRQESGISRSLKNLQVDEASPSRGEKGTKRVTGLVKNSLSFSGESSSSDRGKKAIVPPQFPVKRNPHPARGIVPSGSSKSKNLTLGGDKGNCIRSSGARLSIGGKTGPSNLLNNTSVSSSNPPIPRLCRALNSSSSHLPHELYAESSSRGSELLSHINDVGVDDPFDFIEFGLSRRDRLYMGAVAGMLREMERVEVATGMPYEQFLQEADALLQGLSFRDQHRDMRMDIDNMSYEELLDLEERMGTVSTALSEEELSGCVKRGTFQSTDPAVEVPEKMAVSGGEGGDVKCSICQEEYVDGEETGVLGCEHSYHAVCLHRWMKVKNWCPVCKASAN